MEDIQRLEQNQQRLNKQLERNEKMLENLRNQRNFLEQAKAWDDLAQKQDELKDGKEDIQEAAEKQAEINEQAEQLESKQEKVSKKQMSEDERKELSEEMQRMEESLEEAQEQLQGGQKSKAKDSQKKSSDSMRKMASQMRQAMAQQSSSKQKEDAETIRQLLKGLMYLSFEQEDMSIASRQTAQFDPAVEELNRRQARMNEVSRMVSDTLGALAARNPKVGNYILDESMHMSQYLASSGASLRERNLRGASSSQMLAMTHANNLALMLQESLEQMQQSMAQNMPGSQSCEKPGGGQQGLSDVIKKQKGLGEKMQQQQGGTQPGQTGYSAEQLAGILAEQEKLRQEINALKQKAGDRQAKLLLQEIQDLMEEQEEDISMRRLDQRVMNRQKEILTRMLESDRAIREREQDEQRESGNLDVQMREGALRTKEEDVQTEDVLQVQPIRFKPHFQRVADQYSGGS